MKASYILALIAVFAVSSISATDVSNSKLQNQEVDGNNAKVATADGSLVGAPGLAQGGVKIISSENNGVEATQDEMQ